ncbi:MAG: hypothetical protein JW874_13340, partial [Spirochaetales bacterium]|nr:hypothetical protein [Spirochaetales bacterium]
MWRIFEIRGYLICLVFFTGKQWDPDAGLYYFNARWYDPDSGRFITVDP